MCALDIKVYRYKYHSALLFPLKWNIHGTSECFDNIFRNYMVMRVKRKTIVLTMVTTYMENGVHLKLHLSD